MRPRLARHPRPATGIVGNRTVLLVHDADVEAGRRWPALPDFGTHNWQHNIRIHRNTPRNLVYPIRGMYLEAIDRAAHHIYLTHAYLIPDDDMLTGLIRAAARGVDVRIIVPAESNHIVADWLSRGYYGQLLRGGVRLLLFQVAMVHLKMATIDGQWSTIGLQASTG